MISVCARHDIDCYSTEYHTTRKESALLQLKHMTIGRKLCSGVILLLFFVSVGLGLYSYRQAYDATRVQIEENAPEVARLATLIVRDNLDSYMRVLTSLAGHQDIRSMDWTVQSRTLADEKLRNGFLALGIASPDGQARYGDGSSADLKDRAYFQFAMKGETAFSDIIISRVTNSPVMMIATPIRDDQGQPVGVLVGRLDAVWLSAITDQIRWGQKGYAYAVDKKGTLVAHPNKEYVLSQKNFIEEAKSKPEYAPVSAMLQKMISGESGIAEYTFLNNDRIFSYTPIPGTTWSLAVGAEKNDVFRHVFAMRSTMMTLVTAIILAGIAWTLYLSRGITRPLKDCVAFTGYLAQGDFSRDVPEIFRERGDEIGDLARAFHTMVHNMREVLGSVIEGTRTVSASATEMSAISEQSSQSVRQISAATATVASAAEQMSANTVSVAAGMEQTSANLSSVASATEEMTTTIAQISRNAEEARGTTDSAARQAECFARVLGELSAAAREIGDVTQSINQISSQTNLLALNATIEAARAGAAGKGFAVVANEIKELARQTATATDGIREKIAMIQAATGNAVTDVEKIVGVISEVNLTVGSIAAAIEEQAAVTREVAGNIAQASAGVQDANTRAAEMAEVSRIISVDISGVEDGTRDLRSGGEQVMASASELSQLAEQLSELVGRFILQG